MKFPTGPLQAAFVARYRGDSTLAGLLGTPMNPPGNIFDASGIPAGQAAPYVEVFPITVQLGTALAMDYDAADVYMQVKALTRYGGMKQARDIMEQVYLLTHRYSFTLSNGLNNFFTLFQNAQELPPQEDGFEQLAHRYKLMLV